VSTPGRYWAALAAQHEHLGAVHEAVHEGGDRRRVAEDPGPGGERPVRADDDRGAPVAGEDDAEPCRVVRLVEIPKVTGDGGTRAAAEAALRDCLAG
jgi:hypothetical protein